MLEFIIYFAVIERINYSIFLSTVTIYKSNAYHSSLLKKQIIHRNTLMLNYLMSIRQLCKSISKFSVITI